MMVLKIASAASPRRGIHLFPRKRLWDPRWVLGDMHLCGGEQPLPASSPTHAAHICGLVRCPVGCKVRAFEAPLLCEWVDHVPTSLPSLSAPKFPIAQSSRLPGGLAVVHPGRAHRPSRPGGHRGHHPGPAGLSGGAATASLERRGVPRIAGWFSKKDVSILRTEPFIICGGGRLVCRPGTGVS